MKIRITKKPVDSIIKRKTRRGFVLNLKKDFKKRVLSKPSFFESKIASKPASNFSIKFFPLANELIRLFMAQSRIMKITAGILIISLNWLGISAIGKTTAYFIDSEMAQGNTFSAGTLDFSVSSPTDGFVSQYDCGEDENDCVDDSEHDDDKDRNNDDSEDDDENNNGKKDKQNNEATDEHENNENEDTGSLAREIKIKQEGSMVFQYIPSIMNIAGNMDLCDSLTLQAELAGEIVYYGNIENFNLSYDPIVINEKGNDIWNFIVGFPNSKGDNNKNDENHSGENSNDKSCQFSFSFRAWQVDLGPEYGFGTEKEIQNIIKYNSDNESDEDEGENENENGNGNQGNQIEIQTSLTFERGNDNSNSGQENENSDIPPDTPKENSVETEENSASDNASVSDEGQNTPVAVETPAIDPVPDNSDNNGSDNSNEKDEKDLKSQNQAENMPIPTP